MCTYLKNKQDEINKQANTMQSLFSYIKAQRNPVEKILLKKSRQLQQGWFEGISSLDFYTTRFLCRICNPIDEIPLKKNPVEEILS